jgi:hypothetical protein
MSRHAANGHDFRCFQRDRRAPRREIIELLAGGSTRTVGEPGPHAQHSAAGRSPSTSACSQGRPGHCEEQGQHRLYQLNAEELKPVHDWVKNFERFWSHHVDRIKERAERIAKERIAQQQQSQTKKEK